VQDCSYGFNLGTDDNGNLTSMVGSGNQSFSRVYGYGGWSQGREVQMNRWAGLLLRKGGAFLFLSYLAAAPCAAQTRCLHGTVIAYDPVYHSIKQASFVRNREVVIAEIQGPGKHKSYVKVVIESFGQRQLEDRQLEGEQTIDVSGVRDRKCDEGRPEFVTEIEVGSGSGKYMLNRANATSAPPRIEQLRCYRVTKPGNR